MHNYTHEYKRVTKKTREGNIHISQYLGSRCSTEGCQDGRNRATLDLVKRHNDATGEVMFPAQSMHVQK
jgi:hypothetical protein